MTRGGVDYLIDTSALRRLLEGLGRDAWSEPVEAGLIGMCDATELEYLYSARSADDRETALHYLSVMFPWIPMPERVFARARDVQEQLTDRGWHRSAGSIDLLVAATAELMELTLVHQDGDFETVAKVTGQETRWLLPSSSTN